MFLVRDRAWALAHLDAVLAGSDNDAAIGARGALGRLDADGQKALAAELRANGAKLPASKRDELELTFGDFGL